LVIWSVYIVNYFEKIIYDIGLRRRQEKIESHIQSNAWYCKICIWFFGAHVQLIVWLFLVPAYQLLSVLLWKFLDFYSHISCINTFLTWKKSVFIQNSAITTAKIGDCIRILTKSLFLIRDYKEEHCSVQGFVPET
jgi:hypothetical protein